jgi:hypothetical protein
MRVGVWLGLMALLAGSAAVGSPLPRAAAEEPVYVPELVSSLLMVAPDGTRYEKSSAAGDSVESDYYPFYRVFHRDDGGGSFGVELPSVEPRHLRVGSYPEECDASFRDCEPPVQLMRLTVGSTGLDGPGSFTIHSLPSEPNSTVGLWFTWEMDTRDGRWYGEARVGVRQTQPELTSTPGIIEWPDEYPGLPADTMPITFNAQGSEPVRVEHAQVTAGQSEFTVESTDCDVLQPGESCHIDVGFTPTSPGPRTGLLTVTDSTAQGVHQVPLLGGGIPGETSWYLDNPPSTGFTGAGRDTLAPDRYDFDAGGSPTRLSFAYRIEDPTAEADFYEGDIRILAPAGRTFAPGETFTDLPRFGQNGSGEQDVTIDHIGCNSSRGTLTVNDISYAPSGNLTTADLDFTQLCDDRQKPLAGHILWRADPQPFDPPPGDTESPAPVSDLRVVSTSEHPLELRWADSASPDWVEVIVRGQAGSQPPATPIDGYPVYRGRFPVAYVDDLAMDGTHSFSVFVRDAAGNLSPAASLTSPDVVPPNALEVEADASTPLVKLSWPTSAAADYDHVVATAARWPGGEDETVQVFPGRPDRIEMPGLDDQSFWQVWVRPVDTSGNVGNAEPTLLHRTFHVESPVAQPQTITCGQEAAVTGKFRTEWSEYPLLADDLILEERVEDGPWTLVTRRFSIYGDYVFAPTPCVTTEYRVRFDGQGNYLWSTSPTVTVTVEPAQTAAPEVSLRSDRRRVSRDERVRFTSTIDVVDTPVPARLQGRTDTGWRTLRETEYADGRVTLSVRPRRTRSYRMLVPPSSSWLRSSSDPVRVQVR